MGAGNDPRYSSSRTFETFPFPWRPGQEPAGDPRVEAVAAAARELVAKRDAWLNPGRDLTGLQEASRRLDASGRDLSDLTPARTLTALYNARPAWLDLAHRKLDAAVLDAYGWPHDVSDEEVLERLLALNRERAKPRAQHEATSTPESDPTANS